MSQATIAVSEGTRRRLQELAEQSGQTVAEVLERAVEEYHSRQFWEAVNRGYAELRANPEARAAEEVEERKPSGADMDHTMPKTIYRRKGGCSYKQELEGLEQTVRAAAERTLRTLGTLPSGLDGFRRLKFAKVGRHPLEDRDLNVIEQVNQTFTYLVSFAAVRLLFEWHPEQEGFRLNLGTRGGSDVESFDPRVIAAETFAAVTPGNNDKLRKDIKKVAETASSQQYVFFYSLAVLCGPQEHHPEWPQVKVFAVQV